MGFPVKAGAFLYLASLGNLSVTGRVYHTISMNVKISDKEVGEIKHSSRRLAQITPLHAHHHTHAHSDQYTREIVAYILSGTLIMVAVTATILVIWLAKGWPGSPWLFVLTGVSITTLVWMLATVGDLDRALKRVRKRR